MNQDENNKIIRGMIEHENTLLNHRINWLVTIQGLLFAGLGFTWDKSDARGLVSIFCMLAILVSCSAMISFFLATKAMNDLLLWWDNYKVQNNYSGPDVKGLRSSQYKWFRRLSFLYPWHALPIIFILAWLSVLFFNLLRG